MRVAISAIVTAYMASMAWPFTGGLTRGLFFALGYLSVAALFAIWVRRFPVSHSGRRYAANLADIAAITVVVSTMGPNGAVLMLLYLWVIIGSGFRYGIPALIVTFLGSLVGFAIAAEQSGLVRQHPLLASSMWLILLVLPSYTAHLIRVLHTALAEVREASAAKSQFLARMSHELRTPLNGITGAVELIEASRRLTAEERTLLDVIRQSVGVSLRQINGVLDFSKLQAGKLVLERGPFDLHEVLHSATNVVRPIAMQKGLRVYLRVSPEMPYRLLGDAHLVREILLNLLSNAVKFTEQGSVWIEASRIVDTGHPKNAAIVFEVGDTGVGIPTQALDRIFEPFVRADETETQRRGGAGLGASVAKQLTELMGGRIGVRSTRGEGTIFRCEIPFETAASSDREESLAGARCLLISKDNALARRFKAALSDATVAVVHAENDAIRLLTSGTRTGDRIRVVLIDAELAIARDGHHWYQELCDIATEAQAFPILLSRLAIAPSELRHWGYVGAIRRNTDAAGLRKTVRAYIACRPDSDDKVVQLGRPRRARPEKKPRILLADANRMNLTIVKRMLERAGYDVEAVRTGDAALQALASGGYRLGILDMHLTDLDGASVLHRYRESPGHRPMPIIALAANAGLDARPDCADSAADAYFAKPVTATALLREIKRLLPRDTVPALSGRADNVSEAPLIDEAILRELDRLYQDPEELSGVIRLYENDGERALEDLARACATRNYLLFLDRLHALKGNAANVGAMKLMALCQDTQGEDPDRFMAEGSGLVKELRSAFTASLLELRKLAAIGPIEKVSEE